VRDRTPSHTEESTPALIKFCGITRVEDARQASLLVADYVGVIFTDSPRRVDARAASAIFEAAGPDVAHVAVFGQGEVDDISATAKDVNADVIQLHGGAQPREVEALRGRFFGEIWAVVGLDPGASALPLEAEKLARVADGILLDTRVAGRIGGTGVPLDWERLADAVVALRDRTRVILGGGLDPGNVAAALRALRPDVVDVSSGVEALPGIKDHGRMRAFAEAARSASIDRGGIDSSSRLEAE
jgi:phosphoribosylanthranilate isomerase